MAEKFCGGSCGWGNQVGVAGERGGREKVRRALSVRAARIVGLRRIGEYIDHIALGKSILLLNINHHPQPRS